ncbi:hypothetical protein PQR62_10125 [Herbaspirillum lusitanum]|jgi:hypothetical protein|uniref:Uncharacterized protein n=1 Tax=Herbaspirillum lusitanum TaxID=213312 RepID=A0ABW9A7C5_9BURK
MMILLYRLDIVSGHCSKTIDTASASFIRENSHSGNKLQMSFALLLLIFLVLLASAQKNDERSARPQEKAAGLQM